MLATLFFFAFFTFRFEVSTRILPVQMWLLIILVKPRRSEWEVADGGGQRAMVNSICSNIRRGNNSGDYSNYAF